MTNVKLWPTVIHSPVTTLAAIKAIDVTNYSNAVLANVYDLGLFSYDAASSATPNDITVIQPDVGPGRWMAIYPNVSAPDRVLGSTSVAGEAQEIPFTSVARNFSSQTTTNLARSSISAASSGSNADITSLSNLSTLNFTSVSPFITFDQSQNLYIKTNYPSGASFVDVINNANTISPGTSSFGLNSSQDINNTAWLRSAITAANAQINSGSTGSGVPLPLIFRCNGTTLVSLNTNGTLSFPTMTASSVIGTDASKNITSLGTTGTGNVVLSGAPSILGPILNGNVNIPNLTPSRPVFTDASDNLISASITGSGSVVLETSPSISSPTLSGTITASGLTASRIVATNASSQLTTFSTTGTGQVVFSNNASIGNCSLAYFSNQRHIEVASGSNSVFFDFHSNDSGPFVDYDVRILSSGGTSGTIGQGLLSIAAGSISANCNITTTGSIGSGSSGGANGRFTLFGSSGGFISITPFSTTPGSYFFYLPTTAGTSGQALLSGGGSAAMTWSNVFTTGAAKSDQVAATSSTLAVTPSVQQFHPSAAKMWVTYQSSGGTSTVRTSYNVTSVVGNAVGTTTVNLTTAMTGPNFCYVASSYYAGSFTGSFATLSSVGANSIQIVTATPNTAVIADSLYVSCAGFGQQ